MTMFTIPADDWRFAVTMVLVCVPFMLLITVLQTRSFALVASKLGAAVTFPARLFARIVLRRRGSRDGAEVPDNRSTATLSQRRVRVRRAGEWSWPWGRGGVAGEEGAERV